MRDSMADLIVRLRRLIGDSGEPVFTDDELQDYLDDQRQDYQDWLLVAAPRIVSGSYSYKDFWAQERLGNWENDAEITNSVGTVIEYEDTSEPSKGHWVFAQSQTVNLYLTGKSYDLYGAAVDVLKAWAAKEKLAFDFSSDDQSFKESQKVTALLALAKQYESKARAGFGALINTEMYANRC